MGIKYFNKGLLSVGQQVSAMGKYFPNFKLSWQKGIAIWIGFLRPTNLSETYQIKVRYSIKNAPEVWVLSPELINRPTGETVPHVYSGRRLCLYYPKNAEWNRNMLISNTIIPWTSLWLYYYEIWHATGEWLGGGVHPK